MPSYEYRCSDCSKEVTVTVSIHEKTHSISECATCGGTFKRVWSATPVQFKGSGFYKTDNA